VPAPPRLTSEPRLLERTRAVARAVWARFMGLRCINATLERSSHVVSPLDAVGADDPRTNEAAPSPGRSYWREAARRNRHHELLCVLHREMALGWHPRVAPHCIRVTQALDHMITIGSHQAVALTIDLAFP
jgi:hypothetical protein